MPKVIHKIKSSFHLKLRRGSRNLSDPYSFNDSLVKRLSRALQRTLGSMQSLPRCSRTFIRSQRGVRIIGTFSSLALLLIITLSLSPVVLESPIAEGATAFVPSETTLTMTTNYEDANLSLAVSSSTGTFASSTDAETARFSVTTTNYTGYKVTIAASDDNGLLTNSESSTTIQSLSASTPSTTFANSSDTTTYNNRWGYMPSILNTTTSNYDSLTSDNYLPSPTTTATTINTTNCANNTTSCPNASDSYAISLGARIDYTKPAGTYTKTFILNVVGNPTAYAITYSDNSGDSGVTNLPSVQAGSDVTTTSITLSPDSTPTRTGYNFIGWCSVATTTSGTICPTGATTYQSGDTFYLDQTTANAVTLYAVWKIQAPYIQDYTTNMCSTEASSSSVTVIDKRDDKDYQVRYINGNCWMVQNLRYTGDTGSSANSMTIKAATSNVSADTTLSYGDLSSGDSYDEARIHIPTSGQIPSGLTANDVGVWYNYAAASAETITGPSNSTNATYDVCPKGWRLPTHSEIIGLKNISGLAALFAPIAAGLYNNSSFYSAGDQGNWWTSTEGGSLNRYYLRFWPNNSPTFNNNADGRYMGMNIRCIRDNTIQGIGTMQSLGSLTGTDRSNVIDSMTTNTEYSVTDTRDNQVYTIKKLGDGNVWMTRNLAIGCNGTGSTYGSGYSVKTLTSATSNVGNSNYTTSTSTLATGDTTADSYTDSKMTCSDTYGAWYNYAAATAGTITGSDNSNAVVYDICPTGWRMPTESEMYGTRSYLSAFNLSFAGTYHNGVDHLAGWGAYLWTTGVQNSTDRRVLGTAVNDTNPGITSTFRYSGVPLRCILGSTMQGVSSDTVSNMSEGSTLTLLDARDDQAYTTTKINGQLWMTRNLAIGCNGTGSSYGSSTTVRALESSASNVTNTSASPWNTPTNLLSTAANSSATSGYNTAAIQCNTTYGAWYNYAAASAGTITGNTNDNIQTHDICPAGWRTPTTSEQSDIYSSATTFFNGGSTGVVGGYYLNGSISWGSQYGFWWSATASSTSQRYNMCYRGDLTLITCNDYRYLGLYLRCIKST